MKVSEWAAQSPEICDLVSSLQPLCREKDCVGSRYLSMTQDYEQNKKIFLDLYLSQKLGCNDSLEDMASDLIECVNCTNYLLIFKNDHEGSVLIVQKTISNTYIFNNDNWIVISIEPVLIMSMYGAILGIHKSTQGVEMETIMEGDSGWDDFGEY